MLRSSGTMRWSTVSSAASCDFLLLRSGALSRMSCLDVVDPDHKRIERIHGGTHLLATTDHNIVNRVTLKFLQRSKFGAWLPNFGFRDSG